MSGKLKLEDFAAPPPAPAPATVTEDVLEGARLEAFDKGYKEGWDDATRAAAQDQDRIGSDMAARLQDLGFTYHEARSHVMRALTPLLDAMLETLLPEVMMSTLGARIREEIEPLADRLADTPIELVAAPADRARIEPMLAQSTALPLKVVEDPGQIVGQVHLRLGRVEKLIDLDGPRRRIAEALAALDDINKEVLKHG